MSEKKLVLFCFVSLIPSDFARWWEEERKEGGKWAANVGSEVCWDWEIERNRFCSQLELDLNPSSQLLWLCYLRHIA